ncbi:MAG: rod shape-determining protein MreC [Patescibacteria group bacterium]|jgi:rod shape-determining protein MreC|nr:rod shape-determining protein MreC [Patescibacteria group bacterium]
MIRINQKNPFVVFVVVIIILIILHFTGITKPLENFFLYISRPLATKVFNSSSSLNDSYNDSQSKKDYFKQIEDLENKVAELTVFEANYREVLEENQKLKDTLSFSKEKGFDLLAASVVAGEMIDTESRDLTINRGKSDGLKPGMAVVDEEGILIGKIIETKKSISKACLSIGSDCDFAAAILNSDKTQGIVNGNMGLTIKMSYIPQSEEVANNDIVITSGLGGGIPRGLVIGRVNEVKSEDKDIWQEAIIEPPVDFDNLTIVSVIMP